MSDSKASASVKIVDKWRRRSVADEVSICWICGLDLVEPRTLPCLHSFCSDCLLVFLQTYETKGRLDRIFRCPQCKTLVPNYIPEKVSTRTCVCCGMHNSRSLCSQVVFLHRDITIRVLFMHFEHILKDLNNVKMISVCLIFLKVN